MGSFLDITPWESLSERWLSVGWDGLTDAERDCLSVEFVVARTSNSGLGAARADLPKEWPLAIAGLRRVGANRLGTLLEKVGAAPSSPDDAVMRDLETEFWEIHKSEDLNTLVEHYMASNRSQFPGPRSLEALWQSQRARGVTKPPRALAHFERAAAADRQTTAEVCARCGQPLPSYRTKCRRCGHSRAGPAVA